MAAFLSSGLLDTEPVLGFTGRRGSLTTATETVSHKASLAFSRSPATKLLTSPLFPSPSHRGSVRAARYRTSCRLAAVGIHLFQERALVVPTWAAAGPEGYLSRGHWRAESWSRWPNRVRQHCTSETSSRGIDAIFNPPPPFRRRAGKSTIMSALFRLVELTSGSISIDGIDISTLGLKDLRRSIVMIPQVSPSSLLLANLDGCSFLLLPRRILFCSPARFARTSTHSARSRTSTFGMLLDERISSGPMRARSVPRRRSSTSRRSSTRREQICRLGSGRWSVLLERWCERTPNWLSLTRRLQPSTWRPTRRSSSAFLSRVYLQYRTDGDLLSRHLRTIRTELQGKTLLCIAHRLRTMYVVSQIIPSPPF